MRGDSDLRGSDRTPLATHHRPRLRPAPAPRAELQLLHRWLDSWRGLGDIVGGMRRLGYDLRLTGYGNGMWRATFWVTGTTPPALGGSAYEAAAWGAVQRAAGTALDLHSADR